MESVPRYDYVLTAHKPTAVTQSAVGSFTGSAEVNLIVAKSYRLEIHRLTEDGLQGILDVPFYGRISVLKLFRPKNFDKDILFILTERYKFCVLEYTSQGKLQTLANGDLSDKIGRPSESGHVGIVDPSCSIVGLHLYDGHFKVIPVSEDGSFGEAFNIRLDELKVIDVKFLNHTEMPSIAVLFEDTKEKRHIRTYMINVGSKESLAGPWLQNNLDRGSSMLIPDPKSNGCIVIGEDRIHYCSATGGNYITIASTMMKTWAQVGTDGSRFLLSDFQGNLFLLVLESGAIPVMKLEKLGKTSIASSICYLDSGIVFIGSSMGDSNLIKLHAQKIEQTDSYVELIDSMPNIGPIVDFSVIDLDRQGQGQIVTCSGGGRDGSLRIIRNGIGFNGQANIELSGVKGIWSVQRDDDDALLILSFINETRVLGLNMEEELDELDLTGLEGNMNSIHCSSMVGGLILQVIPTQVRIMDRSGSSLIVSWAAPNDARILAAASTETHIAIALNSRHVVVLQLLEGGKLESKFQIAVEDEVSCLHCSDDILAVGLWNLSLVTFSMDDSHLIESISLAEEVMARSILVTQFEESHFLLCGLGDGSLISYRFDDAAKLQDRKKLIIGTKPITLRSFRYRGNKHVFAASDRPTVIHCLNGKLVYSNLNEGEVNYIASFDAKSYPDCLVLVKPDSLEVGTMDNIQKLHVRSIPLHEQPRRIAHMNSSKTLLVTTTLAFTGTVSNQGDKAILFDDQTFETLDKFQLLENEMVCSATSILLKGEDKEFFAVGSAFSLEYEAEPEKGRIRLFSVENNRLSLVAVVETKGAVFSLSQLRNSLIAGINSRIQIYEWEKSTSTLNPTCGHSGHTIALQIDVRGDLILVGDLMKSLQLHIYKEASKSIELVARDFNPAWMASSMMLGNTHFIGADSNYNLFTLRWNDSSTNDEDRCRLNMVGQYHLGDFVNRFREGSLVMRLPDSEISKLPTTLFGTINGAIGVIAALPEEHYKLLNEVQNVIRQRIHGVGGLNHAEWRSFHTSFLRGDMGTTGYIDGDLLEQILDLSSSEQERILSVFGDQEKANRCIRLIEDLSRLH